MSKKLTLFCLLVFSFLFSSCAPNEVTNEWIKNTDSTTSVIINEVEWTAHWEWFYRYTETSDAENKVVLKYISASYTERDKTSKYYQELAYRHGDSSVYVNYHYTLKGIPLEDNWFLIEQTLLVTNGWDEDEVFLNRVTRFEEKLVIEVPDQPY